MMRMKYDDFAILDPQDLARQWKDRRQIRRNTGKIFSYACNKTGALLDGVQSLLRYAPDDERVISFQIVVGKTDRLQHIVALIQITFHGMHARLAVVCRTHGH